MTAPIALQLYTIRESLKEDFVGTLQRLAEIGYVGVESFGGLDAAEVKKYCDEFGLQIMGTHMFPPIGDDKQKALDMVATLATDTLIVPGLPVEKFTSVDGIQEVCDILNESYANASAAEFRFGYHNHDREFVQIDGEYAYNLMLERLNPNIFMEVDTYWVETGGVDVLGVLKKLGARSHLLHIKDGPATKAEPQVAVGDGNLDIPAIIHAHADFTEWLIVELDHCATDMMEAVARSYQYLVSNNLARGNK
jgi:sugar phosphate isomerase/epimerase